MQQLRLHLDLSDPTIAAAVDAALAPELSSFEAGTTVQVQHQPGSSALTILVSSPTILAVRTAMHGVLRLVESASAPLLHSSPPQQRG